MAHFSIFGGDDTQAQWEVVMLLYQEDNLQDSYEMAMNIGVGMDAKHSSDFRFIEGEWLTRSKSKIEPVSPGMDFEHIPDEVGGLLDELKQSAFNACTKFSKVMHYHPKKKILITILCMDADTDWATNRWGYCENKKLYYKLCLPHHLTSDLDEFSSAVAHEFAHVICSELSSEKAPLWLEESICMYAEGGVDKSIQQDFIDNKVFWLIPEKLESALQMLDEIDDEQDVWAAYQQCAWIGEYIFREYGAGKIKQVLELHTETKPIKQLFQNLIGSDLTNSTIKKVFGVSTHTLFEKAYDAMTLS